MKVKIKFWVDNPSWDDDEFQEKSEREIVLNEGQIREIIERYASDIEYSEGDFISEVNNIRSES